MSKSAGWPRGFLAARDRGAAIMLTYAAHLVKNGAGMFLNRLMQAGLVTHLATQGAGVIHDWEFAFQGESGESVRDNAQAGTFGTWDETGRWINLAVLVGAADGLGFGEAVGKLIAEDALVMPSPADLRRSIAGDPSHPLTAAKADLLWTVETFQLPSGRLHVEHPFKEYSVLAWRLPASSTPHRSSGDRLRHHRQSSPVPRWGHRPGGHDRRSLVRCIRRAS